MAILEPQTTNFPSFALAIALALALGIAWTLWMLRKKPTHNSPTSLYQTVLTSSEYTVKGKFEE